MSDKFEFELLSRLSPQDIGIDTDYVRTLDENGVSYKDRMSYLAKAFIEKYEGSYLAGTERSVKQAFSGLASDIFGLTESYSALAGDVADLAEAVSGVKVFCVESGSIGIWSYKKYSDGTFRATRFSTQGSTGRLTQIGSSGIYYGTGADVPFPDIGITSVNYVNATCAPSADYFLLVTASMLSASSVHLTYLRFGSGTSVQDITWTLYIEGTWA